MRRILLLTVAGVASAAATGWGLIAWLGIGAPAPTVPFRLACLFPALSVIAFLLYFVQPRAALLSAWLLLTAAFLAAYLFNLQACLHHACGRTDTLRIAWATVAGGRQLWALAAAAACLLLDHTAPAPRPVLPAGRHLP